MYELIAVENVSLDGVMQSPGRPDEDTSGGFERGGWASSRLAEDGEAVEAAMGGQGETAGLVFGHRTYDDLVGHWLDMDEPNPFADILRATPKHVASRDTSTRLRHPNSHLLGGEAAQTVAQLKASGEGDLILLGSCSLLHALQEADLVDGYILTALPVVLGNGQRLFSDRGAYADMTLVRSSTSARGAFVGEYRRSR